MSSAARGEGRAAGRVLAACSPLPPPGRRILSEGLRGIFAAVSLKIMVLGSASIDLSAFLPFPSAFTKVPPSDLITAV